VSRRASVALLAAMTAGFFVGCGVNEAADRWLYGVWTFVPYNYVLENLVHGKAAAFGVAPWWVLAAYMAVVLIPPYSVGILALITTGCWYARRNVLVWMTVPFVLVHAVVGHKEPRFLLPLLYVAGPLFAVGVDAMPRRFGARLAAWLRTPWGRTHAGVWCAVNLVLMGVTMFAPANDTYRLDRWLWDQSRTGRITVYAVGGSPYDLTDTLTNSFYRSDNVDVIPVHAVDQIGAISAAMPTFAFYKGTDAPAVIAAAGTCAPVVQGMPLWLVDGADRSRDVYQATICRFGDRR
jgi:hypothetical protein